MRIIPDGYAPLGISQGFVAQCGGFYVHAERPVLAMRVLPEHLNSASVAHGGFLATLADAAFGTFIKRRLDYSGMPLTVSLNLDYISAVREGDWLEAQVDVHKVGARLANASCLLKVGDKLVLRSSGTFILPARPRSPVPTQNNVSGVPR
ncbi:MAG: PaaI family thioesterase [Pseudomonadota bacterium]